MDTYIDQLFCGFCREGVDSTVRCAGRCRILLSAKPILDTDGDTVKDLKSLMDFVQPGIAARQGISLQH